MTTTIELPEGHRIARDDEPGWTYHGLWITDEPTSSTAIDTTEITYNHETGDYDVLECGECIGNAKTYQQAEQKRTAYLASRKSSMATPIDVTDLLNEADRFLCAEPTYAPLDVADLVHQFGTDPDAAYAQIARLTPAQRNTQALAVAARMDWDVDYILNRWEKGMAKRGLSFVNDEPIPTGRCYVSAGWDRKTYPDLACVAALVLLPLAHLKPYISKSGDHVGISPDADIVPAHGDHAIVCNLIDALNEVAVQLPYRPDALYATLHVDGDLYQVFHTGPARR